MGLGGISIWQLLIVLAIVILLFGTKRLRNFGSDLGNAVKGFRKAMDNSDENANENQKITDGKEDAIEGSAEKVAPEKEREK